MSGKVLSLNYHPDTQMYVGLDALKRFSHDCAARLQLPVEDVLEGICRGAGYTGLSGAKAASNRRGEVNVQYGVLVQGIQKEFGSNLSADEILRFQIQHGILLIRCI